MEINKVHNIDFLNNTLPDKCANLIIVDPPYYEVKGDFDFIWKTFDDYLADVEKWAIECKRLLKDNGTLFWWGHAKKIAYSQIIIDKHLNLENVIKWRKTDCQTRIGYDNFNSFPPVTEHLLMYSVDYTETTRNYIRNEIIKAKGKIVLKEINQLLGTATNGGGVASACLSLEKSEPMMFTEDFYIKLQKWCYPHLQKEYKDLARPFNNFMRMEDVWDFAQDVHITGMYDHPTQKTEKISRLMIKTTTRKNDTVIVPFAGSGTECAMAVKENCNFYAFEITKKHADMSNKRVSKIMCNPCLPFE